MERAGGQKGMVCHTPTLNLYELKFKLLLLPN